MKTPTCSVCQTRYNEEHRSPLLLNCGHAFCKDCLSRMFSSSLDNSLSCPRCRHVTLVGNSVSALRKNYALLPLTAAADGNSSGEDSDSDGGERAECAAAWGGEMVAHGEVRLGERIGVGEARRTVYAADLVGRGGRKCRHKVAVKTVTVEEEMDVVWVTNQLEGLRRGSMWCRNVCSFYGTVKIDRDSNSKNNDCDSKEDSRNCLFLVMDRCYGSVQSEMLRNEGRLTLEQILR